MSTIQQRASGAYFPLPKQRSVMNQQFAITHGIRSIYLQLNIGLFNGLISMYKCNRLQHGHQALRIVLSNVVWQNCESALLFISIFKLVFIPVLNIKTIT